MDDAIVGLLADGTLTFREMEKASFDAVKDEFRRGLVELLEKVDQYLMEARDTSRYENRGFEDRELETVVGLVRFKRRRYRDREDGRDVYLLDERLGIVRRKTVSGGIAELMVLWSVKGPSYRDARDRLHESSGYQVVSHEWGRQQTLRLAEAVRARDAQLASKGAGERRAGGLFLEADGVWASLQGACGGKREAKVVVAHEGWQVRQGRGATSDYKLVRPRYFSGLGAAEELWERVRGDLAAEYADLDRTLVVLNGDDAAWIERGREHFGTCLYQRDRYHVTRDVAQALGGQPRHRRAAMAALRVNDIDRVAGELGEARRESGPGPVSERQAQLEVALARDADKIVDYRVRLSQVGYQVPASWRGMGAAEATVKRYKHRIAKHGRSWSVRGLEAILTLQDKLYDGTLVDTVKGLSLESQPQLQPQAVAGLLPREVPLAVGRGSHGARAGHFPTLDGATTAYSRMFRRLIDAREPH